MPSHHVCRQHFTFGLTPAAAKDLFKASVRVIHLEISAYCNRHCDYCPVALADRASSLRPMADSIFSKVISELAEIDYAGRINLNLYNEPTADRELLLRRLYEIRTSLPNAPVSFNSNGDYLTPTYLDELADAGLQRIHVTLHLLAGKPYDDASAIARMTEFAARLGRPIRIDTFVPNWCIEGYVSYSRIAVHVYTRNFNQGGTNRGGLLEHLPAAQRTAPCSRPYTDVTISHDGTIFPCCQFFADSDIHKRRYSVGNITQMPDIFSAYASEAMSSWRASLLTQGPKQSPCDTCSEINCPTSESEMNERDQLYRDLIVDPVAGHRGLVPAE